MNNIIIGVDGSETAQAACREAATLAGAVGAKLHLVTAVGHDAPVTVGIGSDAITLSTIDDAELMLNKTVQSLPSGLDVTSAAIPGKPSDVILAEADRLGADLIVVGNARMQGVKRALGSVANDISHHAPCSVYIAKTT